MIKRNYAYVFAAFMLLVSVYFSATNDVKADPKFLFTPGFEFAQIYDDNIFDTDKNKDWDFYTSIKPYFDFYWQLRLFKMEAGYKPTFILFPKHFNDPNITEFFHNAYLGFETEFSGGLRLEARDTYNFIPFSYSQSPTSPSNLSHQNEFMFRTAYDLEISPTVELDAEGNFRRYDASGTDSDGYRGGGSINIRKDFNSSFNMALNTYANKYWYDSVIEDPLVCGVEIEPEMRIFSHIKGALGFGYRYLNLVNLGGENSFTYRVDLIYETLEGEVGKLFFSDEFLVDLSGGSFTRRSVGLEIDKNLRENLRLFFRASYSWYSDKAANRTDGIFETSPALEFDLGRDFKLETGYDGFFNRWGSSLDKSINNKFYVILKFQKRLNG